VRPSLILTSVRILDTEKQLLNFLFSKGAYFSKWQEPRRVDFRSNDDDDDDMHRTYATETFNLFGAAFWRVILGFMLVKMYPQSRRRILSTINQL
jgi:hypothetical protein